MLKNYILIKVLQYIFIEKCNASLFKCMYNIYMYAYAYSSVHDQIIVALM